MNIERIPGIMDANRWPTGAALMRRWFAAGLSEAPAYGPPDTSTVTMRWVLGFRRAETVYNAIINQRIWDNAAGRREIVTMLRRKRALGPFSRAFGALDAAVPDQDGDSVNYRVVGMALTDRDDLSAALGRFVLKVVVAGDVTAPADGGAGHQVRIREVGVYVRDQYDFAGEQDLGYWNDADRSVSFWNPLAGDRVTNRDFRDWRQAHGRGGDFLVYSDLRRVRLRRPSVFVVR